MSCCQGSIPWPRNGGRMPALQPRGKSVAHTMMHGLESPLHSLNLPAALTGASCDAQNHFNLRIRTSAQQLTSRKKLLDAAAELLSMNRMRACVCVVLRARSELNTACLAGVHRRPYVCDRYRYGALLHQKRVCTASSRPKTNLI